MHLLREYRIKAGMTQKDLAAATGIKQPSISALESGSIPKITTMRAIIKALRKNGVKCKLDDVFPDTEAA